MRDSTPRPVKGRVRRLHGVTVHASVPQVRLGEVCHLVDPITDRKVVAEVIGLADDLAVLTPIGDLTGLSSVSEVVPTGTELQVPVGTGLLGRVINALGEPLDGEPWPPREIDGLYPVMAQPVAPFARRLIDAPIRLGIRALDGLLTCARGQRVGIFGEPGSLWEWSMENRGLGSQADILQKTDLDDIPVKLLFELGRVELSLAEIRQLAPGALIPVQRPLEEGVDILANGRRIGRGNLVQIGASLGIRITRLFDNV